MGDLSGTVQAGITFDQIVVAGVQEANFEINQAPSVSLAEGTGANQADVLWSTTRTLPLQTLANPSVAPTVAVTGGGATGGLLPAGTYHATYTWTTGGGETLASPESASFTVAAGNIPRVTLPSLPAGATAATLYLTPAGGGSGTELRFQTGITTTTVDLATAGLQPPTTNTAVLAPPTAAPSVTATGGGTTGGLLAAGTYRVSYAWTTALGETTASPETTVTISAGNVPTVTLPALPSGATGTNVYVSRPGAGAGTGLRYTASPITATTLNLAAALPVPPTVSTATLANPTTAPSLTTPALATALRTGTYQARYTYTTALGETLPSPELAAIVVSGGTVNQLALPNSASGTLLPPGATGINLYLSSPGGASGTEARYMTGITASPVALAAAGTGYPSINTALLPPPQAAPTVNVTGGTGAQLAPGSYYVALTFVNGNGETTVSSTASFTVAADQVPRLTLPSLPGGATGINVYLSAPGGTSTALTKYNSTAISTTTYDMGAAAPAGAAAPPATNTAILAAPTAAPTVNATGGGSSGGSLAAGNYLVRYTWVNAQGETPPSPESASFAVAAGNIPQVTIPSLPAGVSSASLYLTQADGSSGKEIRYATGITATTANLSTAVTKAQPNAINTAQFDAPSTTPTIAVTGGGSTGGNLQAGTYYLRYTFVGANGLETTPSPESASFTVAAGNIPQVTLQSPVPTGVTSVRIYLTVAGGSSGSEAFYLDAGAVTTANLTAAVTALPPPAANTTGLANPSATLTFPAQTLAAGGQLAAGTYYLRYTIAGGPGETLSAAAGSFTVASLGDVPNVTLPALPAGGTGYNLYLTAPGGASGTETLYATGVAAGNYALATAAFTAVSPPGSNTTRIADPTASPAPAVSVTGGGSTGGSLAAGSYYLMYTFAGSTGETAAGSESAVFTVAAGNIPRVSSLQSLPTGATGYNIYLTRPGGASGSEILYAKNVPGPTYDLAAAVTPPAAPGANTAGLTAPSAAPTLEAQGTAGGALPLGLYSVKYTFTSGSGETTASPAASFRIAEGGATQALGLPALPTGGTGINIYLSPPDGGAGSEVLYASGVESRTFVAAAAPTVITPFRGTNTSAVADPAVAPAVTVAAGTSALTAGTYHVQYTLVGGGGETKPSPEASFTLAAGQAPRLVLTAAPTGTTYRIYLTAPGGSSGTELRYEDVPTSSGTSFLLTAAADPPASVPAANTTALTAPATAPTVSAAGGGSSGGLLQAGSYFLKVTATGSGGETTASPESVQFAVTSGSIPQVTIPAVSGATGYNLYLTAAGGGTGTEFYYAAAAATTVNLAAASGQLPTVNQARMPTPATLPTVAVTGGGSTGGSLAAGVYRVQTAVLYNGGETRPSPESATFTVAAGNIPRVTVPTIPTGASGVRLYVTAAGGASGTAVWYGDGGTGGTVDLSTASLAMPVANTAVLAVPAAATVNPSGGSVTGALQAGTYYARYTWTTALGETTAGPESAPFTVATGNIPRVTFTAAPAGYSGTRIYLTATGGATGTETLYGTVSGAGSTYDLAAAATAQAPPTSSTAYQAPPTVALAVADVAGSSTLSAGTYLIRYTWTNGSGETTPGPEQSFVHTAGQVLQITGPASIPSYAYYWNLYISVAGGASGSELRYQSNIGANTVIQITANFTLSTPYPTTGTLLLANPSGVPSVSATGGGSTGGLLAAGTYLVSFTIATSLGETLPTSNATLTVAAGNIPTIVLPGASSYPGATGAYVYISSPGGGAGTMLRYSDSQFPLPSSGSGSTAMTTAAAHPVPPASSTAALAAPAAPTVAVTGGGSTGGSLQAGTYRCRLTLGNDGLNTLGSLGGETVPSAESTSFTVAAGNIPRVTLTSLPTGATFYNLYLTAAGAAAGSEQLYAARITGTSYDLSAATQIAGLPTANTAVLPAPTAIATVAATGGGSTGGSLQAGTYRLQYTWVNAQGETTASPESTTFTVAAGNIPQVTLPSLPAGLTTATLYLTPAGGLAGSEVRYATGVTAATTTLAAAASGATPPLGNTAALSPPTAAATVVPAGGGFVGSLIPAGNYYVTYTWINTLGETTPGPEAGPVSFDGVGIPLVILPSLPTGATAARIYLTAPGGASGAEILYLDNAAPTDISLTAAWSPQPPTVSTAGTAVDVFTLTGGALTTILGAAVNFARIKAIALFSGATADGQDLWLGGGTNPWASFFGASSDTVRVGPGGFLAGTSPLATGWPVTAGVSDRLQIDGRGVAITYTLVLLGASA